MITALGSRYGISGALGRSVKRASTSVPTVFYPTADDMIMSAYPTFNCGASNPFNSGVYFSWLMKFDLSAASGQTIATAILYAYKADTVVGLGYSRLVKLYSVSSANSDWIEGTKTGAQAGSGEPCWNAKEADGSGGVTTAWAGSAGCATSGIDYEATQLAQSNISWTGTYEQYDEMPITFNSSGITRLQQWIDTPTSNYGLVAPNHSNYYRSWFSREESNDSYKPKLVLTYS